MMSVRLSVCLSVHLSLKISVTTEPTLQGMVYSYWSCGGFKLFSWRVGHSQPPKKSSNPFSSVGAVAVPIF